jgi:hypothetical protein
MHSNIATTAILRLRMIGISRYSIEATRTNVAVLSYAILSSRMILQDPIDYQPFLN